MKAVGIVSEYNPFHLGHLYHVEKLRKSGAEDEVVICALSGDFVQRGEPAVISKFARAEAAVRCGADLVAELPSVWSMQSAEGYAGAAVTMLASMGIERIGFGTETEDVGILEEISSIISDKGFEEALYEAVKKRNGLSYPAVREEVLRGFAGEKADLLRTPNNILAVEYMKAVIRNSYDISFTGIMRKGAEHDGYTSDKIRSASQLRDMLLNGENIAGYIPDASCRVIREEIGKGRGPVSLASIEQALVSRLRGLKADDLKRIKDCDEELAARITEALYACYSLNDVFAAAKTRKYTHSRIRRVCLCAALGITAEMQTGAPPYFRILAAGPKGQAYLRQLKKNSSDVPLATKAADIMKMGDKCKDAILTDSRIHDIYVLGYKKPDEMACGEDIRRSPFML